MEDKYVFINLCMCEKMLSWIFPKLVYALGIRESLGFKPVVLDWDRDEKLCKLYSSYGIDFISIRELRKKNLPGLIRSFFSVGKLFMFHNSGESLIDFKYDRVSIGGPIYDKLIRFGETKIYTIDKLSWKRDFSRVLGVVWLADTMGNFFHKHSGSCLIMDDFAFDEEVMVMEAIQQGVDVRESSSLYEGGILVTKEEIQNNSCKRLYRQIKEIYDSEKPVGDPFFDDYTNDYFAKRLAIVKDKESYTPSRKEFAERLQMDPDKKNVFILASCYGDVSHGKLTYLFKDYYEFIAKTLEATKDIPQVNWILKAHPFYHEMYHEENVTGDLFECYKNPNLHYMPDDWAKADLGELADVIITAMGSGGNEYACKGIPAVVTAYGAYSGYGFTKDPETKEDYFQLLKNINKLTRLNSAQIAEAKKLLYCNKKSTYQNIKNDAFSDMYMANRALYFSGEKSLTEVNRLFLDELHKSYWDVNALRSTVWYKRGQMYHPAII